MKNLELNILDNKLLDWLSTAWEKEYYKYTRTSNLITHRLHANMNTECYYDKIWLRIARNRD